MFAMITCMQFLLISGLRWSSLTLCCDVSTLRSISTKVWLLRTQDRILQQVLHGFQCFHLEFSLLKQFFFPLLPSIAINPLSLDHFHLCPLLYLVKITPQDCFNVVVTQFLLLLCCYNIIVTFDSA